MVYHILCTMKNIIKISALLLLTIAMSCNKNDDSSTCEDTLVNFTSLEEEYGCTNTPFTLDINLENTFTVIRSQDAFTALTTGECAPEIDFETYDLIIGKQALSNGFDSITYVALEDCTDNAVNLTVTFTTNLTAIAPNATYHILVSKLTNPQGTTVDVIIN